MKNDDKNNENENENDMKIVDDNKLEKESSKEWT